MSRGTRVDNATYPKFMFNSQGEGDYAVHMCESRDEGFDPYPIAHLIRVVDQDGGWLLEPDPVSDFLTGDEEIHAASLAEAFQEAEGLLREAAIEDADERDRVETERGLETFGRAML